MSGYLQARGAVSPVNYLRQLNIAPNSFRAYKDGTMYFSAQIKLYAAAAVSISVVDMALANFG